jgi:hypothetical protein
MGRCRDRQPVASGNHPTRERELHGVERLRAHHVGTTMDRGDDPAVGFTPITSSVFASGSTSHSDGTPAAP